MTHEKDGPAGNSARRRILWPMPRTEFYLVRQRAADNPNIVASETRRLEFDLAVARNAIEYLSDAATTFCEQRDRAERLLVAEMESSARLDEMAEELRAEIEVLKGKGPIP